MAMPLFGLPMAILESSLVQIDRIEDQVEDALHALYVASIHLITYLLLGCQSGLQEIACQRRRRLLTWLGPYVDQKAMKTAIAIRKQNS